MNITPALGILTVQCLWLSAAFAAEPAAPPAAFTPQKQSLAIPLTVQPAQGQPAPTVQCVVTHGPAVPIGALAFSPDGRLLAVGGYQEVLIWDLAGAKLARRIGLEQPGCLVHSLAFSNDGKLLAVPDSSPHGPGAVKVFDVATGQVAMTFQEPKDVIYCVAFSIDGKLLVAGGVDTKLYIWSVAEKKLASTLTRHGGWILSAAFSPDGKLLTTGGSDKIALVWEVGTWKELFTLKQLDAVNGAAFSPDSQYVAMAVGGPADRFLRVRRRTDGWQPRAMDFGIQTPLDVVWAHKTNRVFVPSTENTVRVYDGGNGRHLATYSGHTDWVYSVAVTPDGARAASGSADGTVKLWNTADNRILATLVQITPRTDQWVIVAAPGYLMCSAPNALSWQTANVKTPPGKIAAALQNPEMVVKAMAGEKIGPATLQ